MNAGTQTEPTVGALIGSLAHETGVLVKQEVELAKLEITAKTKHAARATAMATVGGAAIHIAMIFFGLALVVGLANIIPMWLSASLTGCVFVAGGYALVQRGVTNLKQMDVVPRQTERSLKEDALWVKEQIR